LKSRFHISISRATTQHALPPTGAPGVTLLKALLTGLLLLAIGAAALALALLIGSMAALVLGAIVAMAVVGAIVRTSLRRVRTYGRDVSRPE
jgi:hypothetical protein